MFKRVVAPFFPDVHMAWTQSNSIVVVEASVYHGEDIKPDSVEDDFCIPVSTNANACARWFLHGEGDR